MINLLSTTQKIAVLILCPLSWWLMVGTANTINMGNVWLDILVDFILFFVVPYVVVRASLPIVAFFEVMFKK